MRARPSRFDVAVDSGALDGQLIANSASASGLGATAGRPVAATSPKVTSVVRRPPVEASLTVTPRVPTAGEPATGELTVINERAEAVDDAVVTFSAPGADLLSAQVAGGGRCSVDDDVARCALGRLEPGERATVRVRLRPHDRGVVRPRVTLRGDGVAAQRVILRGLRVKAGRARLSIQKTTHVAFARSGGVVRYRIIVGASRRAATAHGLRVCDLPAAGLKLRAVSRGGELRRGRACWRLDKLAPGEVRKFTAVARVTVPDGVVRNTARARGSNVSGRRGDASVASLRVLPPVPGGCAAGAPRARAAC